MNNHLKEIQKLLQEKSNPEALAAHQKFVPGNILHYVVEYPINKIQRNIVGDDNFFNQSNWK